MNIFIFIRVLDPASACCEGVFLTYQILKTKTNSLS
jgi:hypothetical protein